MRVEQMVTKYSQLDLQCVEYQRVTKTGGRHRRNGIAAVCGGRIRAIGCALCGYLFVALRGSYGFSLRDQLDL